MILPAGSFVFLEGEAGDRMYLVRRGSVRITKRQGSRTEVIAVVGAGAILGEMSLLDEAPRSASAETLEETELAEVDRQAMERAYAALPAWFSAVVRSLVHRLRETTAQRHESDLQGSLPAFLFLLSSSLRCQESPDFASFAFRMREIHGSSLLETRAGLEALASLGLAVLEPEGAIRIPRPALLEACYARARGRTAPPALASRDADDFAALEPALFGAAPGFAALVDRFLASRG